MKKVVALVVTLALVGAFALNATMAYLTGQTAPLTNVFTVGDINIDLDEPNWEDGNIGKIIPGEVITKDPTITVEKGSESCYLFVYLENTLAVAKAGGGWDYVTPNIDNAQWESVASSEDGNGVTKTLYQYIGSQATLKVVDVSAATADLDLPFFTTVTVPGATFTKASMEALAAKGLDMTIQAYAHQAENVTLADALTAAKSNFGFSIT